MQDKIPAMIEYAKKLLGIKYEWWTGQLPLPTGAPMYAEDGPAIDLPVKDGVKGSNLLPQHSCVTSLNCAGLINVIIRHFSDTASSGAKDVSFATAQPYLPFVLENNIKVIGGTYAYYHYYKQLGVVEEYDRKDCILFKYPEGSLIGRKYSDIKDQGHLGILINTDSVKGPMILQSIPDEGVNMKYTLTESDEGNYYDYIVRPEHWIPHNKPK